MIRLSLLIFFSVYVLLPSFIGINTEIFHKDGIIRVAEKQKNLKKLPLNKSYKKLLKKKSKDARPTLQAKEKFSSLAGWAQRWDPGFEEPFIRRVATESCRVLRN